ncbi:MAG: hypothetical protein R3F11_10255 [Verrucomicrobiales bacterium]
MVNSRTILDGDTDRQIAAIWRYLAVGTELPPGFPDFDQGEFEIIPAERPVVQRWLHGNRGRTHAVAVGFPQGVHFAFDARTPAASPPSGAGVSSTATTPGFPARIRLPSRSAIRCKC